MFIQKSSCCMLIAALIRGLPSARSFYNVIPTRRTPLALRAFEPRANNAHTSGYPATSYARGVAATKAARPSNSSSSRIPQGQEWIKRSIEYYTKVMRVDEASSNDQSRTAKRLYHAIQQVRRRSLFICWRFLCLQLQQQQT